MGFGRLELGRAADGATLIELLVVLAILGIMAGLAIATWGDRSVVARTSGTAREDIARTRREALVSGRAVRVVVTVGGHRQPVMALPDGRVLGAERLGLSPLNGTAHEPDRP